MVVWNIFRFLPSMQLDVPYQLIEMNRIWFSKVKILPLYLQEKPQMEQIALDGICSAPEETLILLKNTYKMEM